MQFPQNPHFMGSNYSQFLHYSKSYYIYLSFPVAKNAPQGETHYMISFQMLLTYHLAHHLLSSPSRSTLAYGRYRSKNSPKPLRGAFLHHISHDIPPKGPLHKLFISVIHDSLRRSTKVYSGCNLDTNSTKKKDFSRS